ncbi:metallophosphoesterase family protein [Rhodohalobacter barkolensis]|uniref:Serine/threonine protein phosphatase n=1 Tax=Rhodohalobacter barkolensis TaxID=2053187 RepID=A0A2N0VK36_9BACT|nr:metallophosphoesterase family protein [Rhodohalobacter barkolensis]PKD44555.1 serine/threonine protein phosphatase [Rhodohalobacter barkolensis]
MTNQLVAIGDIHGCSQSLKALWDKLEPFSDASFIFIGDYIDRGPDSKGVVDFLLKVQNERNCIFLRGNHEQMLLDSFESKRDYNWLLNGGDTTLESYGVDGADQIPDDHLEFYINTKLYYQTDDYFFVHAGVPPHQPIRKSIESEENHDFFLWGRDHIDSFETPWEKTVIFGHTPRPYPIQKKNMIGIDTGCVYEKLGYGKLTAVLLPEQQFIQQTSLDF